MIHFENIDLQYRLYYECSVCDILINATLKKLSRPVYANHIVEKFGPLVYAAIYICAYDNCLRREQVGGF